MSYEQLMQHAQEIRQKAIQKAIEHLGGRRNSREYMSQKRPEIERTFADIPELFQPFAEMPTPVSFDPMINEMRQTLGVLSSGQEIKDPIDGTIYPANIILDKLSGSESYIEDWTGRAAMAFKSGFVDPFPSIARNQFIIAAVLKSAMEANKEMWATTRGDIDQIAHKTIEALDRMDDCGKNEWTITFTVVASIAAVAAVPVTAGGSTALAITAIGAASQVAAAVGPDDPPSNPFSGESPESVVSQMRQAIHNLTQEIGNVERKISGSLQKTHELLSTNRPLFVSRRPELASATARTIRSPEEMGYST
ncbi:MAG TPA: hypothetical protein VIS06_11955 [Mycobacteriales bacterium]